MHEDSKRSIEVLKKKNMVRRIIRGIRIFRWKGNDYGQDCVNINVIYYISMCFG